MLRGNAPGLPVGPVESEGQNPPASVQGLLLGVCVFTCATDWKSNLDFGKARNLNRERNRKAEGKLDRDGNNLISVSNF